MIYSENDASILKHLEDDGFKWNLYYLPIIPMILVNGATELAQDLVKIFYLIIL